MNCKILYKPALCVKGQSYVLIKISIISILKSKTFELLEELFQNSITKFSAVLFFKKYHFAKVFPKLVLSLYDHLQQNQNYTIFCNTAKTLS